MNNENRFISSLKAFGWGYVLIFLILTVLGVLSFCFTDMLKWVVFTAGAIIALLGVSFGVATIVKSERGPKFTFRIIICASALVCGILTMIFAKSGIEILTSVLGTLFIIDGAFKLQKTGVLRLYKSATWWILLTPALLSVIGGFMLIKFGSVRDENDMLLVAILLGVSAIIDGISNLLTAIFDALSKRKQKEIKDASDANIEPETPEATDGNEETLPAESSDVPGEDASAATTDSEVPEEIPSDDAAFDPASYEDTEKPEAADQISGESAEKESDAPNERANAFEIDIPMIEIHDGE